MKNLLLPAQLRRTYSAEDFTPIIQELPRHRKVLIGQDRAVKALRFGLGNRAPGFNVYVSVPDGDSMFQVIRHFLEDLVAQDPVPSDWCYVNNFSDPYCPNALQLPRGKAREFREDIERFIEESKTALVKTFESEEYAESRNDINQQLMQEQQALFAEINEKAREENFGIKHSPADILVFPLQEDGEPLTDKQFLAMDESRRKEVMKKRKEIQDMIRGVVLRSRDLEKQAMKKIHDLERRAALFAIEGLLDELLVKYAKVEEVPEYLEDLKKDILQNIALFLQDKSPQKMTGLPQAQKGLHQRYEVNVLVENQNLDKAPIVTELNPTYNNLFGKIERESIMGALVTNFTLIRPGALHQANGGYLILPIEDLLRSPFAWDTLKRALRNQRIEIEDPTEKLGFISAKSLKPEPIPLHVQIILIGHHRLFRLLYEYDRDFRKLFKVKAAYDPVMPVTKENITEVGGYIHAMAREELLLPVRREALARLIEYGNRLADHQEKMTTRLEDLGDLLREAHFYAQEAGAEKIGSDHVSRAIREKRYRSDLYDEKIKELIAERVIQIELTGRVAGQVNGLSVLDLGDIQFGRPSKITASVSLGDSGVMDIERESEMGGPIHTKGVLILSGFLYDTFGFDQPVSLSVRLVFEQNYSGVDGDSASGAELCAILSQLSGIPLKQNVAVTGSVNQKGEIQAIGGVNEKIEGFYDVCFQAGLTGDQGVIIPASNQPNLMLREDIVEAVEDGKFRIWAVHRLEEMLEILTDRPAGERVVAEDGSWQFEKGTVFEKVDSRLREMARILKQEKETTANGKQNTTDGQQE